MFRTLKTAALTAAATSLLLGGQFAVAQGGQQGYEQGQGGQAQTPPPAQQQQMPEVSEQQLELYVQAATKITEIRQSFQEKMSSADDAEQAQSLQQEASEEMVGAVESIGLSVEEYNQIAYALQSDPALRERVEEMQGS